MEERKVSGPCVRCSCGALVPLEYASRFTTMTLIPCPQCGTAHRYDLAARDAAVA